MTPRDRVLISYRITRRPLDTRSFMLFPRNFYELRQRKANEHYLGDVTCQEGKEAQVNGVSNRNVKKQAQPRDATKEDERISQE